MRRFLVLSLAFSAMLLQAQTATKGQSATLEARNAATYATAMDAAAPTYESTRARPISSGVVGPKLLTGLPIRVATTDFATPDLASQYVLVHLRVDVTGAPHNVEIVKTANSTVDSRVLAAVRGYHFQPAMLDQQAVPMDLNLKINFEPR